MAHSYLWDGNKILDAESVAKIQATQKLTNFPIGAQMFITYAPMKYGPDLYEMAYDTGVQKIQWMLVDMDTMRSELRMHLTLIGVM